MSVINSNPIDNKHDFLMIRAHDDRGQHTMFYRISPR